MQEFNLCPKCGGVKSQPVFFGRVHPGVFSACSCPKASMIGRAETPEQKRAVIERLYAAWLKVPTLRLGQFIYGSTNECDIFGMEDEALIAELERITK